jgi:hypothetical protein
MNLNNYFFLPSGAVLVVLLENKSLNLPLTKKSMIDQIKEAVGYAWELLFAVGGENGANAGVVVRFLGFLQANPIFLLPLGFYLIVIGINTVRKLITGY